MFWSSGTSFTNVVTFWLKLAFMRFLLIFLFNCFMFSQLQHSATRFCFFCVHSFQDSVNCGTSQYNISCQLVSLHSRACGALHASASGGGPSKFSVDFH